MKKIALLLLLAVTPLFGEPVAVTNAEATRLFGALRSTQSGLTPLNTRNGALNINALRPVVEAYESGQQVVAAKAAKIAANDPAREEKIAALNVEVLALTKAPNTVNLMLFSLSDEEIKDAKVTMDSLAEFFRFLTPSAPKK